MLSLMANLSQHPKRSRYTYTFTVAGLFDYLAMKFRVRVSVWITSPYAVQPGKHRNGADAAGMGLHCQEQSSTVVRGVSVDPLQFVFKTVY